MSEVSTKQIVKEEMKVALENLKAKGKVLLKEELEDIAGEISDALGRVAVRTTGKVDDFYLLMKPMIDNEIDKIDGKEG